MILVTTVKWLSTVPRGFFECQGVIYRIIKCKHERGSGKERTFNNTQGFPKLEEPSVLLHKSEIS